MLDNIEDVAGDGLPLESHLKGVPLILGPRRLRSPILTMGHLGTHVVWSILNARATLFLQRLGIYKSFVAIILMAGPLSGLIVQPTVGVLSDHCTSSWGRRRPYVFIGLVFCCFSLVCLATASSMSYQEEGARFRPFTALIGILGIMGIDISVNTLSAAHRALTMDVLGPEEQDMASAWSTRYGNAGSLIGYMLGLLDLPKIFGFMGLTDHLALLCICAIVFVLITHASLFFLLRESVLLRLNRPRTLAQSITNIPVDLYRCGRTLPPALWDLLVIQFFSWLAWFPVLYYAATWVAEIFSLAHGHSAKEASAKTKLGEEARRVGSKALFYYALTGLVASIVLPWCVYEPMTARSLAHTRYESAPQNDTELNDLHGTERPENMGDDEDDDNWNHPTAGSITNAPRQPWWRRIRHGLTLAEIWFLSQVMFVFTIMFFTCPVFGSKSITGAIVLVSVLGILWSVTMWVPYALLGILVISNKSTTIGLQRATIDLRSETGTVTGLHNWAIVLPQLVTSMLSSLVFLLPSLLFDPSTAESLDSTGLLLRVGSLCTLYAATCTFRWIRTHDAAICR